jgi:hypothetical protein
MKTLPRGALDFWLAFDSIEPIGDEYYRDALVARSAAMYAYCKAGKDIPDVEDFMPGRYKRMPKQLPKFDAAMNQAQFKAIKGMFAAMAKSKGAK